MKKIVCVFAAIFTLNAIADTNLVCNDQNSHAVYGLKITSKKAILTPLVADMSELSKSETSLKYNEGENIFEGKNLNKINIAISLDLNSLKQLGSNSVVEVEAYSFKPKENKYNKTEFLCSLR